MPKVNNNPENKIEKIKDIWFGKEINSKIKHCSKKAKTCKFARIAHSNVYDWSNEFNE